VSNLAEFLHTDWGAMSLHDWIGLTITVIVFVLMVGLYVVVFLPGNRDRLESQRHVPFDDDERMNAEDKHE